MGWTAALDHAKHDGAYEGEGDIGGKNAQLADERHGKAPLGSVAAAKQLRLAKRFEAKK